MAEETEPQEQQDEKPYVRMKREDIQALEAEAQRAKELDSVKKELAMTRAGIDTSSKLGKMFFETYQGEMTTESLQKEAAEIGLFQPETPKEEIPKEEQNSTQERQQLNNGATPPGSNPMHPKDEGVENAKEIIKKGGKYEHAAGAYLNTLVQRFSEGDQRAGVNRNERFNRER